MDVGKTGSTGAVPNSGSGGDTQKVDQKGQLGVGGPSVKKENGTTPQGGVHQNLTSQMSIKDRGASLSSVVAGRDWEASVPDDSEDVFYFASNDETEMEQLSDSVLSDMEFDALDEAGLVKYDDASANLEKSNFAKKFKKAGSKLLSGLKNFFTKFKPDGDVAQSMEKATMALADNMMARDPDSESLAGEVADQLAGQLEDNPGEIINQLEARGLDEVVSDLKSTVKVATNKKLKQIKSELMKHSEQFPALQGMGEEAREAMINAALVAVKLGNAGKTDGDTKDVGDLKGRGYLIGRIPEIKFQMLETILGMSPDKAVEALEGNRRLKQTNFRSEIRERLGDDALEDIGGLFGGNEVEAQDPDNPVYPQVDYGKTDLNNANKRPQIFKDVAKEAASYGDTDSEQLATNMEYLQDGLVAQGRARKRARNEKTSEEALDGLEGLFKEEEGTAPAPSTSTSSQPVRGGDGEANKVKRARAQMEGRTGTEQAAIEQVLQEYAEAKQSVSDDGGLVPAVSKQMTELEGTLTRHLEGLGASKEEAALMTNGLLVANKLAAWTDEDSSSEVTHLGGALTNYPNAMEKAATLAEVDDLALLKDMLLNNQVVTSSDYEHAMQGLSGLGIVGGDEEE